MFVVDFSVFLSTESSPVVFKKCQKILLSHDNGTSGGVVIPGWDGLVLDVTSSSQIVGKTLTIIDLPQKSDASHLGRPQKSLKGEQSRV